MVCPKCGKKNKKDATKCAVCGKKLVVKTVSEKKDELIESFTSNIDVKAIKKAEKSIIHSIKSISPKVIASVVICFAVLVLIIYMSLGFKSVTCSYKSNEDKWLYRSNINFNYKNNEVTRFSMRLEYSANTGKYKEEFSEIYSNIMNNLKNYDNFGSIVKASKSNRHFSIVYNFSPSLVDNIKDYTGFDINSYDSIDQFVNALENSGFTCH